MADAAVQVTSSAKAPRVHPGQLRAPGLCAALPSCSACGACSKQPVHRIPAVRAAAKAHGVSCLHIILRWVLEKGAVLLLTSCRPKEWQSSRLFEFSLTGDEVAAIAASRATAAARATATAIATMWVPMWNVWRPWQPWQPGACVADAAVMRTLAYDHRQACGDDFTHLQCRPRSRPEESQRMRYASSSLTVTCRSLYCKEVSRSQEHGYLARATPWRWHTQEAATIS